MRHRAPLACALAFPLILLAIGSAAAQSLASLELHVREVSFAAGNETQLIVSVSGAAAAGVLGADAFSVTESGEPVDGLSVRQLFSGGQQSQQVSVALLMDVSRSTRDKLGGARIAANEFLGGLPPTVRATIISFGSDVGVLRDFVALGEPGSGAREDLAGVIDGLLPAERVGTKLHDAVIEATDSLAGQAGQHNIVIFSDGADVGSAATLPEAVAAIGRTDAATTSVLLTTEGRIDVATLDRMAEAVEGGTFVRVESTEELQQAFARVAQSISNQYVLTYVGTDLQTRDLAIAVTVDTGTASVTDAVAALNERQAVDEGPASRRGPLVPLLATKAGLYIGILSVFAALLLFIGMIFYAPAGRKAERLLARGLRMYTRGSKDKEKKQRGEDGMLSGTSVGRAAVGLAGRVPRPKAYDEKMQGALDQAAWPLRSTEFILLQAASTIVGILIGFVLFESPVVGILLTVVGALAPRLALSNTIQRRESAFLEQLPDTLQLLSGSLQAGYGFLQAIDTVAKESSPPTSVEFSRVLSEARLGMPLEDALEGMAERLGSDDFRWVVMAINIQRQVGGNLAQLLTTISNTLREREQVRRQIKVLSAEGRLSAVILTVLPFALVGYLSVINPEYLGELTSSTSGRMAIVVALVLMGIGVVWMRKIIRIDV